MGSAGLFICLEGLDGSGKSTQARLLKEKLEQDGFEVVMLREPGGTELGESVRELLLQKKTLDMHYMSELYLFMAARSEVVDKIIRPALDSGKVVLADRFAWSTLAYQGFGRGLDRGMLNSLIEWTCGGIWPHCSFLLDIPVDEFYTRSRRDNRTEDRMELSGKNFFEKVRMGYLSLQQENKENFTIIDGCGSQNEIHHFIYNEVQNKLSAKGSN